MDEASKRAFERNAALYTPMQSKRQTRVLSIEPGLFGQLVHYTLHVIDLDNTKDAVLHQTNKRIRFKALSYCWGDQRFDNTIICNGLAIAITAGLHGALRRVRDRYGSCFLWADAICINQADLNERSAQVGLMMDIFSMAEEVVAWLGEKESQLSLEHALRITPSVHGNESTRKLLHNPWFYRVWIRQEVWAASKITVIYGSERCEWGDLFLSSQGYPLAGPDRQQLSRVCQSFPRRGLLPLHESTEDIVDLLWQARMARCTDPRDSVYGLLGIAGIRTHVPGLLCIHRSCLVVDYTRSLSRVFQDLAVYIMRDSRSLNVLYFDAMFGSTYELPDLPSWAPEWRYCKRPDQIQKSWHNDRRGYDEPCRATGNGVLEVRGLAWGIVGEALQDTYASLKIPHTDRVDRILTSVPEGAITHIDSSTRTQHFVGTVGTQSDRAMIQPLRRRILAGLYRAGADAVSSLQEHGMVYISITDQFDTPTKIRILLDDVQFISAAWTGRSGMADGCGPRYATLYHHTACEPLKERWDEFWSLAGEQGWGDHSTADGELQTHVWGMPDTVRNGDMIVIARGGEFPLILRPDGSCYKLIGHTFHLRRGDAAHGDEKDSYLNGCLLTLLDDVIHFNESSSAFHTYISTGLSTSCQPAAWR